MVEETDYRQRAAETKRVRTRLAIWKAARKLFAEHGWYGTRLQDIAREADVGVGTVHSHFKTKQALIGYIFQDTYMAIAEDVRVRVDGGVDPIECVEWFVQSLAKMAREERPLMLSFLAAVQEQTIKTDGPSVHDDDVRNLAPFPTPLIKIIAYGQQTGVFPSEPQAEDVGAYHTNALLMRVLTRPHETADATASVVLSQILPALRASRREMLQREQDEYLAGAAATSSRLRSRAAQTTNKFTAPSPHPVPAEESPDQ